MLRVANPVKGGMLLQAANITKERLASFDRPIKSEPSFKPDQREGLLTDLSNYLQTLKVGCFSSSFKGSLSLRFVGVMKDCLRWPVSVVAKQFL